MPLTATREQALGRRQMYRTPSDTLTHVSTYIGTNRMELLAQGREAQAGAGPMAYLVEQAANSTVEPHFHQVEQFQLFIGGSGRIGTHLLAGVTLHYAGSHSPYGPIVAGPDGIQYLTLRRSWDPGAQWMPQAAQALRAIEGRRQVAWTSQPLPLCADPAALQGASRIDLHAAQPGEAGACLRRAGSGAAVEAGEEGAGRDRFWYVVGGSLRMGEEGELPAGSCVYLGRGESPAACAAAGGVELVEVQFP
jgi:hypothetical protein